MRNVPPFLFFALLAMALPGEAQQPGKVYRVGMILTSSPVAEMMGANPAHSSVRAFLQEMRERGYVEGQNLIFERRSPEGRLERASDIVTELVRLKVGCAARYSRMLVRVTAPSFRSVTVVLRQDPPLGNHNFEATRPLDFTRGGL